jgi:ABC-type antimicrobial peptide transport system permease subunit
MVVTIDRVRQAWEHVATGREFESFFLEDQLEESLVAMRSMMKIFGFLGVLAIVVTCLGLLAVVISASEGRIKEMGLRKVLGATTASLTLVLSRGYFKLIVISIMMGTPLSYFLFEKVLLKVHYYRASVGWLDLTLGIMFLLVLLFTTIGSQTLRVARVNPVETLKYE